MFGNSLSHECARDIPHTKHGMFYMSRVSGQTTIDIETRVESIWTQRGKRVKGSCKPKRWEVP